MQRLDLNDEHVMRPVPESGQKTSQKSILPNAGTTRLSYGTSTLNLDAHISLASEV